MSRARSALSGRAFLDFLPMIGGALAGIPTAQFAVGHSLTAGIVTATAFNAYEQVENHVLNPLVMSRTRKVNPFRRSIGGHPGRGALQVIASELWQATAC